ncbi:RluA family pseudouridine synthase [Bdellovibrio sp. HCB117]|uniref:RluA family pseudouridine synthase n=1 Tax=Bdellovibrio sp. HCB117 TaxID=3394359 RepID=UPI0039B6DA71
MIHIIFENENFVVCDKESGVLTTPSRFEEDDERLCLGTALQKKLDKQIFPIHRLDFEVSGLVMYAKNLEAHRKANAWFEQKQVQKTYRALTSKQGFEHIPANVPNSRECFQIRPGQRFEWKSRILRGKRRAFESPQGKPSLTIAIFLDETANAHLAWDLSPVTGRSHQLRFDLSRHGFPILGDSLYGSTFFFGENKIALRSYKIDFSTAKGASMLGLPRVIEVSSL